MTEEEWRNLQESFETTWLLDAVGHVDELRGYLSDGENFEPSEIRTNLFALHDLAMDVVNNGRKGQLGKMAELASDLEMQTLDMMQSLDALYKILSKLTELLPEDAFDSDA